MDVTLCIRTHTTRLYLANDLKAMCRRAFPEVPIYVCDNLDPSPLYNELFITNLCAMSSVFTTEYVLILEDDITLSPKARDAVELAIERGDLHNWYTVDTTSDVLQKSVCVPRYGYILSSAKSISYSGAVLVRTSDLRGFLSEFLLHHAELEHPNIDTNLSAYLLREHGHLHLRPGYFLQLPNIKSSITFPQSGRKYYDISETFTYIGPEV